MNALLNVYDMRSTILCAFAYVILFLQQPQEMGGVIFIL